MPNKTALRSTPRKICVFGAGSVGGVIAAKLALAGHEVGIVARPAPVAALRERPFLLDDLDGVTHPARLTAVEQARDLGPQDVVFITLKARSLPDAAASIAPLIGPETVIVPTLNGLPWWYGYHGDESTFRPMAAVDPDNVIPRHLPLAATVGGIIYFAARVVAPGHARLAAAGDIVLGEPDGRDSARCRQLRDLLAEAGLPTRIAGDIRAAIWQKLWGNLAFNPVSALTGKNFAEINGSPALRALIHAMMSEAAEIAGRLGVPLVGSVDERIDETRSLGAFKSSMLQDVENGRPLELAAILGAVVELGRTSHVEMPHLESVHTLLAARHGA